jgi:hypothetical protein
MLWAGMQPWILVAATPRAVKAVAAIHRLIAAWHEGDAGDAAAGVTTCLVHCARGAVTIATTVSTTTTAAPESAGRLARGAALGAPAGCIGKTARCVELLLTGGEGEGLAAVAAIEGLVGIGHLVFYPLSCAPVALTNGAIGKLLSPISCTIPQPAYDDRENKTTSELKPGPTRLHRPVYILCIGSASVLKMAILH